MQQKLSKFAQIPRILNNTFKPSLIQKFSTIKVYNSLAPPILLYGSEIWTLIKKTDKKRLTSIETKFFRRTAGYILFYHKSNVEILEELRVKPVDEKLRRCKSNWLRHVTGMNSSRMAKIMLNYRPNGRRRLGSPLKRLLEEAEIVLSRPNW
jgi:hypothetical protein